MKIRINQNTLALMLIVAVYFLAGFIEPCDGHSCDAEVVNVRR